MKSSTDTPNFLGLRTAIYHAPDLAKAKSWYSKILGIEPYFDQPFYVGFNVGGYELRLDPDPSSSTGAGGIVVYWGVSDAAAALKRLLSLGATEAQTFRMLAKESASPPFLILSVTYSD